MSSLTDIDKRYFEKILGMASGYVLDYSDPTFASFFQRYNVDIHGRKYQTYGTSKARKMRAFWEQEPDSLVARVLSEMLASYEANCDLQGKQVDAPVLAKCRQIVARLAGKAPAEEAADEAGFLEKEFG